ncbi:MBL fold metallo-hydrolase [Solemya velum gill symbiont]|uniref:Zn-dependent hydrolase, glyoxylase n=1 Tax=Solemya velum gill symbiont TaxID=2340 RepID=A0A0B0H3W4_SOVGS|nr:MBL fold metallo-hydrolase [Solemya velum gill symbiont]KHF24858.1 Zn-dependent hydrolase, glyoxylase [Solemya velum gill symbiont]OOY35044.1 hypothetical protein BOV88_06910 [Solemya velum gill symbiont]OOY37746.1 hypothetical protein BOV89_05820 [Solemya velum gill symbiont]OOY40592.1 hypothetical protein BOV90_03395 [Solemya velum gill symbiont]OOY45350.1 hypothetical protein BOV92_05555 [Solemya velum gill symbiont]
MIKGLLSLFLLLPAVAVAEEYEPLSVDVKAEQVSEHCWYVPGNAGTATQFEGFISNAGFVITDEGVVVFDSLGTPALANAMLGEIRKLTDKPIVKVVVSHYHADHVYGLQVFKEAGAEIVSPGEAFEYIDSDVGRNRLDERRVSLFPWVNDETNLVSPDSTVTDNSSFTLGGIDFEIVYLGKAHSDGDLALLVKQDKVLYSGDIIFEGRVPFVGNADTKSWLEKLEAMETEGLEALIPGHGPAATDPKQAISGTRSYLAYLRQKMGEGVEEFMEFAEVYDSVDWSEFDHLPAFSSANRINAYGVYLSLEKELLEE